MKKRIAALLLMLSCLALMSAKCDRTFDRAVAALATAPALIDSFVSSEPGEKQQLKQYFADARSALASYRTSHDTKDWSSFVVAIENIATAHVSDAKGAERVAAIVNLVRVVFGIPEDAARKGSRVAADPPAAPPSLDVKAADLKQLERLMRPIR